MESPPLAHPGVAAVPTRGPLAEAPIARWEFYSLLGVFVVALGLRAQLLGIRPLWYDEAFSLSVARRSLPEIWAYLHTTDTHPIAYYALLHLWIRWFGTDLSAMRTPSLILGVGAVAADVGPSDGACFLRRSGSWRRGSSRCTRSRSSAATRCGCTRC